MLKFTAQTVHVHTAVTEDAKRKTKELADWIVVTKNGTWA